MAFKFLDEPQAAASGSGFKFLDNPTSPGGMHFLEGTAPAKPEDVSKRVEDPSYFPTKEEFRIYREHKKQEPIWQPGKWADAAYGAVSGVISDLAKGGKAIVTGEVSPSSGAQSVMEGAARGTYDLALLGRSILKKLPSYEDDVSEGEFIDTKLNEVNANATRPIQRREVPHDTFKQWQREYQEYKTNRDYERFLIERVLEAGRQDLREGKGNILPELVGKANPQVSEALSYVLDPSVIVPGGSEGKLVRGLGGRTLKAGGGIVENAARGIRRAAEIPAEALESRLAAAKDTPFKTLSKTGTAAVQAPLATVAGMAGSVEAGGQAARAIGEKVLDGPSQFGVLERIAKDTSKPAWLRKSSRIAANLGGDSLLGTAGAAATGAAEGAAVGAGLGFVANGPEGAAAGIGSGGVLGAGGGLVGRYLSRGARRTEAEDADIGRFLRKQVSLGTDPDNLAKLNRNTALAAATADQIFGGAVDIRFAGGDEYAQRSGNGLGVAFFDHGDANRKPQIVVNLDAVGDKQSNLLHELGHALFKSPVVDKSEISSAIYGVYGEDGIRLAADEYARKYLRDRKAKEGMAERDSGDIYYNIGRGIGNDDTFIWAMSKTKKDAYGGDLVLGQLRVFDADVGKDSWSAGDLYVHKDMRRQGIATEMYKRMSKHLGVKPEPALLRSTDGEKMWEGFRSKGVFSSDASKDPSKFIDVTPEELTATKLELAKRDPDWILGEIFAEHFLDTTFDQSLNRLREGKTPAGSSSDAVMKTVLDAKAAVLQALGIPIDPKGSGGIAGGRAGIDRLFKDFQVQNDPKLSKLIVNYLRDRDRFLTGLDVVKESKEKGAPLAPKDLVNHPATGWRWNPEKGYWETDYAILIPAGSPAAAEIKTESKRATMKDGGTRVKTEKVEATPTQKTAEEKPATPAQASEAPKPLQPEPAKPSGQVVLKDPKSIKAAEEKRVGDLLSLFQKNPIPLDDPRVGLKEAPNGERSIRGRVLPQGFYDLPSFNPDTKRFAKELQDAMGQGDVFSGWYHAIGTGEGKDSWAESVRKGLGNLRVSQRDFKPLAFFVSEKGNLLVTVVDVSAVLRKAVRWQTEGKLNGTWGGDLNLFREDMEKYLKNHADGLPGDSNGLGTQKRNELNAFFGVTDKASEGYNPLRASLKGEDKKSLVKSFRVDRLQNVERTGQDNFWFDYGKQKRNFLPDGGARNLEAEVFQLYEEAPKIASGRKWVNFGPVTPEIAAKVKAALAASADTEAQRIDLTGYKHTIDNSGMNHIFNSHGDPATEEARGQVAVTKEDLLRIPEIVKNPDSITYEGRNKGGLVVIRFTKEENGTVYYLEEIRTGRKELAASTLFKTKKKKGPQRQENATGDQQALSPNVQDASSQAQESL